MGKLLAVLILVGSLGFVAGHASAVPELSLAEIEAKLGEVQINASDTNVTLSKEGFILIMQYVRAMNKEMENSKKPRVVVCYKT